MKHPLGLPPPPPLLHATRCNTRRYDTTAMGRISSRNPELLYCVRPKGGGRFESRRRPLLRPPKSLVPSFLQFQILGKPAGAGGTEDCFPGVGDAVQMGFQLCVHSKCSECIGDSRSGTEFAQFQHFPLLWGQLTHVLPCSPPSPPLLLFASRLLMFQVFSTLFLMPPKKAKQVGHTGFACQCGHCTLQCQ